MIRFVMFQLLRDYVGTPCEGWLASIKRDGWRIFWDGSNYVLRGGGILNVPDAWKAGMPGFPLDGELDPSAGHFNFIQGRIRDGFHGLRFAVFDAPSALPFRKRLAFLKTLALPSHCQLVEHTVCKGTVHLLEMADAVAAAGGEGMVIRNPRGLYREGRSCDVLRWVPQPPERNRRKLA